MTATIPKDSKYVHELWNSRYRNDVLKIFSALRFYGVPGKKIHHIINLHVDKGKTDIQIMEELRKIIKIPEAHPGGNVRRGVKRGQDVEKLLKSSRLNHRKKMYLDLGAGNGLISYAIGRKLKLSKHQIHAVDIKQWIGEDTVVNSDILSHINHVLIDVDGNKIRIPYKDNTFDMVTILQALHHFENLEHMLNEIQRLVQRGGIIIIREHDAKSIFIKKLVDIEHMFYGILIDGLSPHGFIDNYYGEYRSSVEWDAIFKARGFSPVRKSFMENPTRHYYAVYRRF